MARPNTLRASNNRTTFNTVKSSKKTTLFKDAKIIKVSGLPTLAQVSHSERQSVVVFDRILLKNASFKKWIAQFKLALPVQAGESLKTVHRYAEVLNQLQTWQKQNLITQKLQFVAIGGGSVGDFTGFLASTYQRGCPLVQMPSTWLSAVDSAHGGKNGLNLNHTKNQVGTIYPADKIILSKTLLLNQPEERLCEAFGEIIKICLINEPKLFTKIKFTEDFVWANLEKFIAAKMRVVRKDPFEKTGYRHILNLGHTMGHVYESELNLSHGKAVLMGMVFAARWSFHLGYMTQKNFVALTQLITDMPHCELDFRKADKLSKQKILNALRQDKKSVAAKEKSLRFIFVKKPGDVFVESKKVSDIVAEFERQRFHA